MASQDPLQDAARARDCLRRYWHRNILLMSGLLVLWAVAGLGCGVLWADSLNAYSLFGTGYPLGFWFAQQGSIIVFVVLVLVYALVMNRLDRSHLKELQAIEAEILRKTGGDPAEAGKGGQA
jgi:putative solute:sodium symporter small subunit